MPTMYVTHRGSTVRLSAGSVIVTADMDTDGSEGARATRQRTLIEVEPHRLEVVALVGRVHITGDALRFCLSQGIDLAWFTRNGRYRGRTVSECPRSADLRLLQFRAHADDRARLERAKRIAAAKVMNAREVVRDQQANDPNLDRLPRAIADLKRLHQEVEDCDHTERLRGLEGAAAKAYFQALRDCFRAEIGFPGREQRPPPDPANALLSLGYVLLANQLAGMLEARGLDPALGFYHEVRPGRPSLALDLLEELRHPVVDRFVLRVCNLRIMRPEKFEPDPDRPNGVRLTKDGLKDFFQHWEKFLQGTVRERGSDQRRDVRTLARRQIERLVAELRGGAPYVPFYYGD